MSDSPNNDPVDQSHSEPSSAQSESPTASAGRKSPVMWLVAGLIAAILVPVALQVGAGMRVPMPAEYTELSGKLSPTDEEALKITEYETANRITNHHIFMIGPGIVMSLVFGLFSGLISGRILMGIVGAVLGAVVAYALPLAVIEPVISMEKKAIANLGGGDTTAMMAHGLQWAVFGIATALAVVVGDGRPAMGGKALVAVLLAAALGAVIYVILGTIIDPNSQTKNAEPVAGIGRFLWTSLPPLLTGFFLSRMGQD